MLFWRKKKIQFNTVEVENVVLHKTESIYTNYDYCGRKKCDKFHINMVARNVPLEVGTDGKLMAKVRYIGIPNMVVYFILKISNIQGEYVSKDRTIDIHVSALIKGEKCREYKCQLFQVYNQGGALACL